MPAAKSPTKKAPRARNATKTPPLPSPASHRSTRTVLLAVSGMSPAILTETVWALAKEKPPVIPDELVVLTTSKGTSDIDSILLAKSAEWGGVSPWAALRRAVLGSKADRDSRLQLAAPRVIELPNAKTGIKRADDDLRTPADFILEQVRGHTENHDVRLIDSRHPVLTLDPDMIEVS